jgi:mono/diheme cytochrome c family protein
MNSQEATTRSSLSNDLTDKIVFRVNPIVRFVIGAALAFAADRALAQSNLDASKSPAEIFADTCGACHESARALKPSNAAFLRKHYTTGPKQAATMAAFLETAASEPPPPAPAKARRPSDSIEHGMLGADPGPAIGALARQGADAAPLPSRNAADEFEE